MVSGSSARPALLFLLGGLLLIACGDDDAELRPADDSTALAGSGGPNACGGDGALDGIPGARCGPCEDGRLRCEPGGDALSCAGATALNACGGCGPLPGSAGSPCGPCGGTWACDFDTGGLVCEGGGERNECGGCEPLPSRPNFGCFNGIYTCDGPNALVCRQTSSNACGGNDDVRLDPPPGTACGSCDQGIVVCDGPDSTTCADDELGMNACGGCGPLAGPLGQPCGCGGVWVCDEDGEAVCDGASPANACGGCGILDGAPGDACDGGALTCDGVDALSCAPSDANACGGTTPLDGAPGAACGTCMDGVLQCVREDALACVGASSVNACGSCGVLPGEPGEACGSGRRWTCRGGALTCSTRVTRNACGGTAVLDAPPGAACGECGRGIRLCVTENATQCFEGPTAGRNRCGGCESLVVDGRPFDDVPGAPCGVCNSGRWACSDANTVECVGEAPQTLRTYHADRDGDGFGSGDETREACAPPLGFVANDDDCDDLESEVRPGASELCDGRDNDCDAEIDEDFPVFVDADRDGFGDPALVTFACDVGPGFSDQGTDCDDSDPNTFPGQTVGFAEPRADGSFDYDCDGVDTLTLTDIPNCEAPPLCGTDGYTYPLEGWAQPVPPRCGDLAPWILSCVLTLEGCTSTVDDELRAQLCR